MMNKLLKTPLELAGCLLATALIASAQQGRIGRPGMINYTEGQVSLDGNPIGSGAIGSTEVGPGEELQTAQGRAEMLLTPGVFVRLDNDSALKMVNPSITDTEVELDQGRAMIEVDQVAKENNLKILADGIATRLEKNGIYEFRANPGLLSVYDGKAVVSADDRNIEVKKGHQLPLGPVMASLKPQKFDRDQANPLYDWSKLRSQYVAEATASSAQTIVADNPGWYAGTGWYWNPWYDSWAFVPGAGFIGSPFGFGFGFYSPAYWYYNVAPLYPYYRAGVPVYRGRVPGGYHGVAPAPRFGGSARMGAPAMRAPAMRAPAMRGGSGGHFGGPRR